MATVFKSEQRNLKALPATSLCDHSPVGITALNNTRGLGRENRCRSSQSITNNELQQKRLWTSPLVEREADDLSAKKKADVLDMIAEKNWKSSIRLKIESDLSSKVAEALEPPPPSRKSDKETRKSFDEKLREMIRDEGNDDSAGFKYINTNSSNTRLSNNSRRYGSQNFSSNGKFPTFDTSGLFSQSMYQFDQMKRRKRSNNGQVGLNFALFETDIYTVRPGYIQNGLRPLISDQHEVELPDYGINRKCFHTYTKEGMVNLLNSKSRRNKLVSIGNGRYTDKRGVILSKLGPFWPQGYGPICQNPEFATRCPASEDLGDSYKELLSKSSAQPSHKYLHRNGINNTSQPAVDGKLQWRGKPVIFDCDRSLKAPIIHPVSEGFDESLVFESRFESGNLRQVRRIGEVEYELVLRTDMYTNRHTQWFYFRLQKVKPGRTYKFNIINFLKKDSLYNYGMRPLVYSEHLAKHENKGWFRSGDNIRYTPWSNPTRNALLSLDLQYFCLEMEISFDWKGADEDTIYMAHCYPYTYTDLRRHLDDVTQCPARSLYVRKEVLCETAAGNSCFLLTVTEFPDSEEVRKDFHAGKKGVVVTARVHPGETQASWMMKGVIDFLTSNHPNAVKLRKKYIFKIVPMLNPDGVIVGNYRTSLAARDLNRNYRHPRQETFPTVWFTKQMVEKLHKNHPIILYCDLHGHSRRHLVFMYGCERRSKSSSGKNSEKLDVIATKDEVEDNHQQQATEEAESFVDQRLFPWLMHRLTPSRFSFHETKYAIRKSKESTGRVVMFKQLGILNSFTLEASFSGTPRGRHFNIDDFLMIGRKLCESVLEYSRLDEDPIAKSRVIVDMTRELADRAEQIALKQQKAAEALKEKNPSLKTKHSLDANAKQMLTQKMSTLRSRSSYKFDPKSSRNRDEEKEIQASRETDQTCYQLLQNLQIFQLDHESESSEESNSDSEPELSKDHVFPVSNIIRPHLKNQLSPNANVKKKKRKKNKTNSTKGQNDTSSSSSNSGKKQHNRNEIDGDDVNGRSKIEDSLIQGRHKNPAANHPSFVSKYANRSNGGIPIFAQERINERAMRRMAELKLIEEERRQHQLFREEIIMSSGLQQPPSIINSPGTKGLEGYAELCGVRYNYGGSMKRSRSFTNSVNRDSERNHQQQQTSSNQRNQPQLRRNAVSDLSPYRTNNNNGSREAFLLSTLVSYGVSESGSGDDKTPQQLPKTTKLLPLRDASSKIEAPSSSSVQRQAIPWNNSEKSGRNTNFFDILRPRREFASGSNPEVVVSEPTPNEDSGFQLAGVQLSKSAKKSTPTAENKSEVLAMRHDPLPLNIGNSMVLGSKLTSGTSAVAHNNNNQHSDDSTKIFFRERNAKSCKKVRLKPWTSRQLTEEGLSDGITGVNTKTSAKI